MRVARAYYRWLGRGDDLFLSGVIVALVFVPSVVVVIANGRTSSQFMFRGMQRFAANYAHGAFIFRVRAISHFVGIINHKQPPLRRLRIIHRLVVRQALIFDSV